MIWLAAALLLLLLALALDLGLLAYAVYTLGLVLIVSRIMARHWSQNITARRETNRGRVHVGDKVAVVIRLKNTGPLPVAWLLLEDLLPRRAIFFEPPNLRVIGRRLQLLMLKGHAQKTLMYQLECNRRGYYQIGPTMLETGDLLGLHRRYRILTDPLFLMVYPEVIPLAGYDIASRRPIGEVRMSHRLYEDPTRIAGVRDYQAGDPLNRVHWRATARTGALHSKVYEPSSVAGATILLEFHQDAYDRQHEPVRSEMAVTTAASLANAVYEMGQQVGLVTNGRDAADRIRTEGWSRDEIRSRSAAQSSAAMLDHSERLRPLVVDTRRGSDQFMRIRETLARVELTDGLNLSQLITESTSRMPRNATVVAIVPGVTDETAVALGSLRRSGYAVTALIGIYDDWDYAEAAGLLLAEGVEAHQLKDREAIRSVCQKFLVGR